jgi:hypothetical protein
VVRFGEDRPEHGVRAAIVGDNEGHIIEIVGPSGAAELSVTRWQRRTRPERLLPIRFETALHPEANTSGS